VSGYYCFSVFTNESNVLEETIINRILTKDRQLKVLDFQDTILLIDYKNLESMIHLKYLSFKYSNIEKSRFELHKRIGMLQNLETLDLRTYRCFHVIPKEISKIRKLRHLLGYNMSVSIEGCYRKHGISTNIVK
jgi:disease resistance protein RPM1